MKLHDALGPIRHHRVVEQMILLPLLCLVSEGVIVVAEVGETVGGSSL